MIPIVMLNYQRVYFLGVTPSNFYAVDHFEPTRYSFSWLFNNSVDVSKSTSIIGPRKISCEPPHHSSDKEWQFDNRWHTFVLRSLYDTHIYIYISLYNIYIYTSGNQSSLSLEWFTLFYPSHVCVICLETAICESICTRWWPWPASMKGDR